MGTKNKIEVTEIFVRENTVSYSYRIEGDWIKYFCLENKLEISYSSPVATVPESVLVIPFLCNVLPIAWLCDAQVCTKEIDKDFYENLERVKDGYRMMYPMLSFEGEIQAEITENIPIHKNESACFFSGGVDAYTTLFRHMEEQPALITIWGADVKLADEKGWQKVKTHTINTAEEFGLDTVFIKSNFRQMINESGLCALVKDSGDNWWHGFQHGIAIIGHAALISYVYGIKFIYIASSYPEKMKGKYTCASDPAIDNHIHYCGCHTVHDGYELDRQEKVRYLVSQKKDYGRNYDLRVCWESMGGGNCCHCEKCYRTILEIVSEGGNPNECGFLWGDDDIKRCKKDMQHKIIQPKFNIDQFYPSIQEAMEKNKDLIDGYKKYDWLLQMDFNKFNDTPIKKLRQNFFVRKTIGLCRRILAWGGYLNIDIRVYRNDGIGEIVNVGV